MFEKYDTHHYVRVDAHVAAIEAVRNETEGLSLRLYVQRKGVDNLKNYSIRSAHKLLEHL
ncbi:MAG: hypothetical protein HWD61_04770 [Parachlamydiaceae bacterium]|nr:MAG: hypothetical protein HWD61_04770 [Parachlamydiaceae bacterium]